MDFLKCMNNFPWNRFATVYETNSIGLKSIFIKMFNNTAEMSDYQYVIDRLECQDTLYRITPWGLKFAKCFCLSIVFGCVRYGAYCSGHNLFTMINVRE